MKIIFIYVFYFYNKNNKVRVGIIIMYLHWKIVFTWYQTYNVIKNEIINVMKIGKIIYIINCIISPTSKMNTNCQLIIKIIISNIYINILINKYLNFIKIIFIR